MKKILMAVCLLTAVLMIGVNSYALVLPISGKVTDAQTGVAVAGAKVVWYMLGQTVTVYTDAYGNYKLNWHHWCDGKNVQVSHPKYVTRWFKIYEGSCCSCNPECPPEYGNIACRKTFTVNFKVYKRLTANESMIPLAVKPELAQITADKTTILFSLLGLFTFKFCVLDGNYCDYECLYQFTYDWANGREVAFGHNIYPEPRELPECPEGASFADFVNDWLDMMFEYWYGDTPPEE